MANQDVDGSQWTSQFTLAAVLLSAVYVVLIALSASGVRGSDQYWYVADVETLAKGLPSVTNEYYPPLLLKGIGTMEGTPFVHNSLSMYLVIPAAKVLGAFRGWILTNTIATIATSTITGYVVFRCVRSATLALIAGGAYAFAPITIWQTSQPLLEATVALFLAGAAALYVCSARSLATLSLLAITLGLGYWCRPSLSVLLPLVPLAAWFESERPRKSRAIASAVTLALLSVFVVLRSKLLVQSMPGSIRSVLANGVNGGSNMDFLLALELPFPSVRALLAKTLLAWRGQFLDFSQTAVFFLPFNLLAAISVPSIWHCKTDTSRRLCWCAMALLGMHALTISIHQNQFRYLLLPMPALIACCCVSCAGWVASHQRTALVLSICVWLSAIGFGGLLAAHLREEGRSHAERRAALASIIARSVDQDDAIVYCFDGLGPQFVYTVRPRRVLHVYEDYPKAVYWDLAKRVNAQWLACPPESPVVSAYGLSSSARMTRLPKPFERYELYHLPSLPLTK